MWPPKASAFTPWLPYLPALDGPALPFTLQRRHVAVLAADVAGYTRLMEAQEEKTHVRLMRLTHTVIEPVIARHRGRVIKHIGDGFLASFETARDATFAAFEIQSAVTALAAEEPSAPEIAFRMGLNQANVIIERDDIFGDGVNLAARLQTYAPPGGVLATGTVAEQVAGLPGIVTVDLGDFFPKNLSRPVRVFAMHPAVDSERASAATRRPPLRPPLGSEERASIAVLPFHEAGAAPGETYFADGIIEGITEILSGLEGIAVIARNSTLAYAVRAGGAPVDTRIISRDLGVRYVLNGWVRRSGDRLRITTELADAETGAVVRADHYDAVAAELFELQDRISIEVAMTIAPRLRERELARALRKHPDSMTAYDLHLQAMDRFYRLDRESFARARDLLQQALSHDPNYAAALAYCAWWHIIRVSQGWSPDPDADKKEARRRAEAAIERDPDGVAGLAAYGHTLSWMREHARAMRVLNRAVELRPNNSCALALSSITCGYVGEGALAVLRAERAIRLTPRDPCLYWYEHALSQAHYLNGNNEEAVRWGVSAAERNPVLTSNLRTLAAALVAAGRKKEAQRVARRQLEVEPHFHLGAFTARTPLMGAVRETFIEQLRAAGLPD